MREHWQCFTTMSYHNEGNACNLCDRLLIILSAITLLLAPSPIRKEESGKCEERKKPSANDCSDENLLD